MMKWRTQKPCSDCPFNSSGAGLHLRKSLGKYRWTGILAALQADGNFSCHQTTEDDEEGNPHGGLLCAGSLNWQMRHIRRHGTVAQVMERVEKFRKVV
jgi:hypothetical protein